MKLGEFKAVDPDRIEFQIVNRDGQRMRDPMVFSVPDDAGPVRVEIHSLDDPPWPTERPPGWGVGWWCRIEEWRPFGSMIRSVVVIQVQSSGREITTIKWVDIESGEIGSTRFDMIQRFGPRAEVPG